MSIKLYSTSNVTLHTHYTDSTVLGQHGIITENNHNQIPNHESHIDLLQRVGTYLSLNDML